MKYSVESGKAPLHEYGEENQVRVPMCGPCADWHEKASK